MSLVSNYIEKFFTKGKIVVRHPDKKNHEADKKLFNSVLIALKMEHPRFVECCKDQNILKIDKQNLIIELVVN